MLRQLMPPSKRENTGKSSHLQCWSHHTFQQQQFIFPTRGKGNHYLMETPNLPDKPSSPLRLKLIYLFSISQQWKDLINYYKTNQPIGNSLWDSICGSFLVNSHKGLKISLEEPTQWLTVNTGLTLNHTQWVEGYVQQSLNGHIHNTAARTGCWGIYT